MLEVVKAKSNLVLHVVGAVVLLFYSLGRGNMGVIFVSSDFGIAQSPIIWLASPNIFWLSWYHTMYQWEDG